jgi:hypothetical protein
MSTLAIALLAAMLAALAALLTTLAGPVLPALLLLAGFLLPAALLAATALLRVALALLLIALRILLPWIVRHWTFSGHLRVRDLPGPVSQCKAHAIVPSADARICANRL